MALVATSRGIWTELQRGETLLIHATLVSQPERWRALFDGLNVDGPARALLIRVGSGFPADAIRPEEYLARYPFADIEAIRAGLGDLVRLGLAVDRGVDGFALSEEGLRIVRTWMHRVGESVSDLDLADLSSADAAELVDFDQQIVDALAVGPRPCGDLVFSNRLRGVRPDYTRPALWHHWQRVWTILGASEDEEEHVRRKRGLDPLVWFVRRQLWFIDRRPWRVRAVTADGLAARATDYAPFRDAEARCAWAVAWLTDHEHARAVDDGLRLTESGLAACDADESEIDRNLMERWPVWGAEDVSRLRDLVDRLNRACLTLIVAQREGRDR